jgi:cytochrome P450
MATTAADAILDPATWVQGPPDSILDELRESRPVALVNPPDGQQPAWLVTRHADVVAVSRDTATFSSRGGVVVLDDLDPDQLDARRTMLEEDPPRHTALRRIIHEDFTPRAVRAYTDVVQTLTSIVLDAALPRRRFDFVGHVAQELPIRVIGRLLGVADGHIDTLVGLGNRMVSEPPTPDARLLPFGHPAALEAFDIAATMAAERRRHPTDDVTTRLLNGTVDGRPLTEREFLTMWLLVVIAGNETTRHAISLGLAALLEQPDALQRWRRDPSLDTTAAEELLRWTTPINWHRRTVTRDTELAGQPLAAGHKVLLSFRAANRDPRVFDRPVELRLDRQPNHHVTFGRGGPHFCLGAHLARLEVRTVMRTLLDRTSDIRLAGAVRRLPSNHFHGLLELPVEVAVEG